MMKIRLTTSLAGAETLPAGSTIETTEDEARRLVEAGFAVYVDEPPAEKTAAKKEEAEERIQDETSKQFTKRETTATRKGGRKRKR